MYVVSITEKCDDVFICEWMIKNVKDNKHTYTLKFAKYVHHFMDRNLLVFIGTLYNNTT